MRSFLSLAIITIFITTSLYANNDEEELFAANYRDRNYNYDLFNSIYSSVPSAMNLWKGGSWSTMDVKYQYVEREFKSTQMFSRESAYTFVSESIQKIDTLDVIFYGQFMYQTSNSFDAKYNLYYRTKEVGSPFYFFVPANGNWQTQKYFVKGGVSKSILNKKMYVGASVSYSGDLFNRTIDIRNSKKELDIVIFPSLTYNISKKQSVSAGVNYSRNKKEPRLSSYFPRAGDDTNYWIYFNKGMGTYEHVNMGYSVSAISHSLDYILKWVNDSDKYTLSADLSFSSGSEKWQSKFNKPDLAEFYDLTKYDLYQYSSKISLAIPFSSFSTLSSIKFFMMDGTGSTYNEPNQKYQDSYIYDRLNISLASNFLFFRDHANKIGVDVSYDVTDRLDLNYGQKTSISTLTTSLGVGLIKLPLLKGVLFLDLNLFNSLNLDSFHDPVSASSNIYTTGIIRSAFRYETSDYYAISPLINWEKLIKNKYYVGFELGYSYINPYKINYDIAGDNSFRNGSNNAINFSLKFVF